MRVPATRMTSRNRVPATTGPGVIWTDSSSATIQIGPFAGSAMNPMTVAGSVAMKMEALGVIMAARGIVSRPGRVDGDEPVQRRHVWQDDALAARREKSWNS